VLASFGGLPELALKAEVLQRIFSDLARQWLDRE